MEKIRNTTIAPRTRSAVPSRPAGPARAKGRPASAARVSGKKPSRPAKASAPARGGRTLALGILSGLVAILLVANLYFLFEDAIPRIPRPTGVQRAGGARNAMLAAITMPGASPAAAQGVTAAASAIEYSTDIDDLSGYSLIVNKDRLLSPEFEPADLVSPDVPFTKGKPKGELRREAAQAYRSMQRAALAEGIRFDFYSGYRDYAYQDRIYKNAAKVYGLDWAIAYSAPAGASEHQTGLAVDISCAETKDQLDESFGATRAGIWLAARCADYGFILRYPKGKEEETGYSYEPWHFRYVGPALARTLSGTGQVLEEFLLPRR